MNVTMQQAERWDGATVVDVRGDKVGTVADVYYDDDTARPEWILVNRGFLGMSESLIPLAGAEVEDDGIHVAFTKDAVKNAPDINADAEISEEAEDRLYAHYKIPAMGAKGEQAAPTGRTDRGDVPTDVDRDDDEIVLGEEVADIGTVRRPHELVRLKKHVVTENVTKTVPVQREEIRVEREPVRGDEQVDLGDDEAAMAASEEEPVVSKHLEPRERVRLEKDVETTERDVSADVRREEADIDRTDDVR